MIIYTDIKLFSKVISSIKLNITCANINDTNTNSIIKTVSKEILVDFIDYFGGIELFFVGTVIDGYSSNESFTDEVLFIREKAKNGYTIEFIYENNKKVFLKILNDGNIYHIGSTTYINYYDKIDYYKLITEYIQE